MRSICNRLVVGYVRVSLDTALLDHVVIFAADIQPKQHLNLRRHGPPSLVLDLCDAGCAIMPAWKKMTDVEVKMAKQWYVDGESTAEIAERLGRNQSSITRLLIKRLPRKKQGRKAVLDKSAVDKLEAKLQTMVEKADGKYEVTIAALKRASRTKASERTILKSLHDRGIYFRRLREKPVLTDQDISDRKAFAKKYGKKVGEVVEHGHQPDH